MSYTIPAIAAHPQLYQPPFPLALIAAVARDRVIGNQGQLAWHLPEDLKHFRMLTTGHSIIMGRKTWESLPHALPNRQNIVITRQQNYSASGAEIVASLEAALACASLPAPIFCIGGGELYQQALPHSSILFLTEIDHAIPGDTFFPAINPVDWQRVVHEPHCQIAGDQLRYSFNAYVRKTIWDALA